MLPYQNIPADGHEFRSLSGQLRASFRWLATHRVQGEIPGALFTPAGGRFPVGRMRTVPVQPFTVNARTAGGDTDILWQVISEAATAGLPVGLVHGDCDVPGCQIPVFQSVWVTSAPSERTSHVDVATTDWTLTVVPSDEGAVGEVAGFSWGDLAGRYQSWGAVDSRYSSWGTVADTQ